MLPFVRMLEYGNKVEVPTVKKFDSIGMGHDRNGGGNWFGAILASNGNLYGIGQTKYVSFGITPTNGAGVELVRKNVNNFWLLSNGIIVQDNDGSYHFCGVYANGIFTHSSMNTAPFITNGFINVSSYFANVGEVVEMVFCGGYDKGPATSTTSPAYTSKYSCILAALNSNGEIWYMGLSIQGLINNSTSDYYFTSFTKDNQLTQKVVSLRRTIDMSHNNMYFVGNRPVLYAKLEDGTIVGKGYNIRYGIQTPASGNQVIKTWTTVAVIGTADEFDATNEGMMYCSNSQLYRCGGGGGFSFWNGSTSIYYMGYNVGMFLIGANDVNRVVGGFNVLTTGIKDDIGINVPTSSSTKIRMNYCGTVIFEPGTTSIYKAHGVYSDYYASPSWQAGAVASFTYEDIGIRIKDAMYVGGTLGFTTYGLLVVSTEGRVYWRGVYNGTTYQTLTEIQLL
ncbi:hypothetical protein ABV23_RS00680 [Escherichia coli]|nr:hypothetical protein [Escherichia coli]